MTVKDYLSFLRRYWRSIMASAVLGVGLAALVAVVILPVHTASADVFVRVNDGGMAREVLGGSTYASAQVGSYVSLASSPLVLQPVIDELGLGLSVTELTKKAAVGAQAIPATSIISVSASQADPQAAIRLTQAIADRLVETIDEVSPVDGSGNRTLVASVVKPAVLPVLGPLDFASQATIGLFAGLAVGVGQAALRAAGHRRRTAVPAEAVADARG